MVKDKSQGIMQGSLPRRGYQNSSDGKGDIFRDVTSLDRKSEKGIALVMVLVLSAVSLMLMTALLYMISVGAQTSGMQKRYRTALEAGISGSDITAQIIGLHNADNAAMNTAVSGFLDALSLNASSSVSSSCTGTAYASGTGQQFSGMAAKIMTSSTTWNTSSCGTNDLIADPTHYDFRFTLGTSPQFNVYAKIVDVVEGNTGSAGGGGGGSVHQFSANAVVSTSNEIPTPTIPYQYTIEVAAENASSNTGERARLSILYQY